MVHTATRRWQAWGCADGESSIFIQILCNLHRVGAPFSFLPFLSLSHSTSSLERSSTSSNTRITRVVVWEQPDDKDLTFSTSNSIMTLFTFFGCALTAYGPCLAIFFGSIAPNAQLVILMVSR
jgi:hypothetical protein